MTMKRIIILLAAVLAFASCKEEATPGKLYDGPTQLSLAYFQSGTFQQQNWSHTWSWSGASDVTIPLIVSLVSGNLSGDVRYAKAAIVNRDAANYPPDGVFSIDADLDRIEIPANAKASAGMNILLPNNPEVLAAHKGKIWEVVFEITETGEFRRDMANNPSHPYTPFYRFVLTITVSTSY